MIKVASLFAGVGGICLGFKKAKFNNIGYEITWANEIDEKACITYSSNFNHTLIKGDVNKLLFPNLEVNKNLQEQYIKHHDFILNTKIDVLTGGFPCQAFSIAGGRKGFEDDRGVLFLRIIELINMLSKTTGKPRILFLENVKNLKGHDKGRTYSVIKSKIEELGYTIKDKVINTMLFTNLPQNRERIFMVCFLNKEDADHFTLFDEDITENNFQDNNVRIKNIESLLDDDVDEKYYYTKSKYPNYFISETEYINTPEEKRRKTRINIDEEITEKNEFYQLRRGMYIRKNTKGVCPTLTANMGTGGHNVPLIKDNKGVRKLTPSETFKLQGFPINKQYKLPKIGDNHLYKQAGNAVSVDVIEKIAVEILKVINNSK